LAPILVSHPHAAAESRVDVRSIPRLSDVLTAGYLEEHRLLPVAREGDRVIIAHAGSPDPQTLAELAVLFDAPLELRELPEDELLAAVQRVYGGEGTTAAEMIAGLSQDGADGAVGDDDLVAHDLEGLANQAPVIRLVNLLLAEALRASGTLSAREPGPGWVGEKRSVVI
jgi:type II secretory ATPase GspE/PulE/Tfp pilus assembly ATPase PilB-like protein